MFGSAVDDTLQQQSRQNVVQPKPSDGGGDQDTSPPLARDGRDSSKVQLAAQAEGHDQIWFIFRVYFAKVTTGCPHSAGQQTQVVLDLHGGKGASETMRRDCACRGSAGWAHLSCLTQNAESKCKTATDGNSASGDALNAFTDPWAECNQCKHAFGNQLGEEIADGLPYKVLLYLATGSAGPQVVLQTWRSRKFCYLG